MKGKWIKYWRKIWKTL